MDLRAKSGEPTFYFAKTAAQCIDKGLADRLADYIADNLPPEQMEEVHQHTLLCTECAVVMANWRNLKAALKHYTLSAERPIKDGRSRGYPRSSAGTIL
jgi:hypothetical protein